MKSKLRIAPTRELRELIEQTPSRLERLQKRALLLDGKPAKQAATELLTLALEVQIHLAPVLMEAPHLLKNKASELFAFPVLIAVSRGHKYHHRRVLKQIRKLNLGSKAGIACHPRANWKSTGVTGSWAVALYNTLQSLRTNTTPEGDHTIGAFVFAIQKDHKKIARKASKLPGFSRLSVDRWMDTCLEILYVFRPDLRPGKPGRRKKGIFRTGASKGAKDQRKDIVARLRNMAAGPDKSRSYKRKINSG